MVDFVSLPALNGISRKVIKPKRQAVSSAGYMMVRPGGTVSKREFTIQYKALMKSQRDALETFFDTYQGSAFNWTDPDGSPTYVVTFVDEDIAFEWIPPDFYSTQFTLRQL